MRRWRLNCGNTAACRRPLRRDAVDFIHSRMLVILRGLNADGFVRREGWFVGNCAAESRLKEISMREPDLSLILWPLAAEEFAAFFRRRLPVILAAQSQSQSDQIRTLMLLGSICDGLAGRASFLPTPNRTAITALCGELSVHFVPALAKLPRPSQLEYRRILKLCELAWRLPECAGRGRGGVVRSRSQDPGF